MCRSYWRWVFRHSTPPPPRPPIIHALQISHTPYAPSDFVWHWFTSFKGLQLYYYTWILFCPCLFIFRAVFVIKLKLTSICWRKLLNKLFVKLNDFQSLNWSGFHIARYLTNPLRGPEMVFTKSPTRRVFTDGMYGWDGMKRVSKVFFNYF